MIDAVLNAEKLASGLSELPEGLGSTRYSVISRGSLGFVSCPDGYPEITVKVFSEVGGEGVCTYEFDTINYARNTSSKPLRSLPFVYAMGYLSTKSESLPAIALETTRGMTMKEMCRENLTSRGAPKHQSSEILFLFALP